ncbi:MAG: hypothetical protein HQL60_09090, partial [Magnetococcales bacterium]|nr:hypothetical protein [Magnetococcales bacterium]
MSGAAVMLNQEIVASNLGNLSYSPTTNWNGSDSFGWNGYDGTVYASSAATVTLAVNPVNDAPTVTGFSKSGRSDAPVSFTASDFTSQFSDVDGDNLNRIRITSLPSNGSLQLSGSVVNLKQEITAANLGNLAFVSTAGGTTGFQWLAFDGQAWSGSAATAELDITIIEPSETGAPTGLALLASDDSGVAGDGITNKTAVTVTGAGEVGAVVTLLDGSATKGAATVGAAGNWSVKVSGLSQGLHALTATQLVAGKSSGASEPLEVSIDTTAPAATTALDLADEDDWGFSTTDNITAATENLTISGKGEAGATVALFADKNKNGRWDKGEFSAVGISVDDEGNWSGVFETLTGGTHAVVAVQTDRAGNASKASTALSVVVDVTPPTAPTKLDLIAADDTGASSSDNVTGVTENLTITGAGEKGLQLLLFEETEGALGEALATATISSKGTWSVDIAALELGDHVIKAKQMDL